MEPLLGDIPFEENAQKSLPLWKFPLLAYAVDWMKAQPGVVPPVDGCEIPDDIFGALNCTVNVSQRRLEAALPGKLFTFTMCDPTTGFRRSACFDITVDQEGQLGWVRNIEETVHVKYEKNGFRYLISGIQYRRGYRKKVNVREYQCRISLPESGWSVHLFSMGSGVTMTEVPGRNGEGRFCYEQPANDERIRLFDGIRGEVDRIWEMVDASVLEEETLW
ncbi:MAG: hypothetical protein PHG63_02990 [Candidatus Dojkabacteria bacterium]|nr:hypothetical protein [Candidatus Dojkabacteria bacterium]